MNRDLQAFLWAFGVAIFFFVCIQVGMKRVLPPIEGLLTLITLIGPSYPAWLFRMRVPLEEAEQLNIGIIAGFCVLSLISGIVLLFITWSPN